jgi:electron transport complex protein RnfG
VYSVFYTTGGEDVTGLAIEAPGAGGYGGDVILMVAVDLVSNQMTGMEIIQHSETPGVGSRVEKAGFRNQWVGLSVSEPVTLRSQGGQIDAISGATYSSKAVVNGTNQIIELVSGHRDGIIAAIQSKSNGE